MQLLLVLVLAVQATAFFLTTSVERPAISRITVTHIQHAKTEASEVTSTTVTTATQSVLISSLMTIAPLSRNPFELRQRCFNDQGFSVNCATWTGYYYSWGGVGHPYAGGPGEGGGSGSNMENENNAISGFMVSANRMDALKWPVAAAFATVCLLVLL